MKNLRTLFAEAKNSNENATLEIIDFFKPIIDRHVRQSKYSEDVRSELTLHLIEIIKTLDFDKLRCSTDYALINYIKKSPYHCYLHISMTEQQRRQKENHYEDDDLIDLLRADTDAENAEDDILLDLLMKNVLTEKEYISKKGGSPPFFLCKINIYKRLIRNVFFKYNVINIAVNILEFTPPDTLEFFKQLIGTQKNRKHFIVD